MLRPCLTKRSEAPDYFTSSRLGPSPPPPLGSWACVLYSPPPDCFAFGNRARGGEATWRNVNEASFYSLSGWLSFFVGLGGLVYGILFATIVEGASGAVVNTWLLLAIFGGLASSGLFVALYERLRDVSHSVAVWALLLGVTGAIGQMVNASVALGYVTEATPGPPGGFGGSPDPLGILRFGLNGVALFLFGWLLAKDRELPKALGYLAQLGGVLLVMMYAGRLAEIIDPAERITLIPPLL
ncbi:MAG: hypothetical protein ACRDJJ_08190, partial [Actinomycetota bacterium]